MEKSTTKSCQFGDPALYKNYRKYRNNISHVIKTCKKQYYSTKFDNATGNLKKTWSLINELRGKCVIVNNLPSHFKVDGSTISEDKDIANSFNSYFCSLAENLNKRIGNNAHARSNFFKFLPKAEESSIFLEDITVNEISEIICELSNDKVSNIPIVVLKHCKSVLSPILAKIFNNCIRVTFHYCEFHYCEISLL